MNERIHEEQNQKHWPVWATEPVKIVNPDPAWSEQALKIIHQLRELLLPFKVTEIEHIGSTAIPNLSTKPIIDIMAKLESWDRQLLFRNRLREQPGLIQQYDVLKRRLAMENQHDREAYTDAKTDFVQNVLNSGHPKD
ncbi:GrpB family protein [Paenibacillus polymyxa]|uniref:GrpB family protein n=1 Tax=Paenibacillus polymyxa TaxID=1406 RepID=UPI002378FEAB|nr:GrpB family protein [Paenibacillus polymyxa]